MGVGGCRLQADLAGASAASRRNSSFPRFPYLSKGFVCFQLKDRYKLFISPVPDERWPLAASAKLYVLL